LAEAPDDPLAAVREHLDEAHAAADRLVREAQLQAEAASTGEPEPAPPRGREPRRGAPPSLPDLRALAALLDRVRAAIPPELSRQLLEAVRDLLLALRALIDWYLERLSEPEGGSGAPEVEEIPLD
jgi:hypothetical protein